MSSSSQMLQNALIRDAFGSMSSSSQIWQNALKEKTKEQFIKFRALQAKYEVSFQDPEVESTSELIAAVARARASVTRDLDSLESLRRDLGDMLDEICRIPTN